MAASIAMSFVGELPMKFLAFTLFAEIVRKRIRF
jgi:hypothetical protein